MQVDLTEDERLTIFWAIKCYECEKPHTREMIDRNDRVMDKLDLIVTRDVVECNKKGDYNGK